MEGDQESAAEGRNEMNIKLYLIIFVAIGRSYPIMDRKKERVLKSRGIEY